MKLVRKLARASAVVIMVYQYDASASTAMRGCRACIAATNGSTTYRGSLKASWAPYLFIKFRTQSHLRPHSLDPLQALQLAAAS